MSGLCLSLLAGFLMQAQEGEPGKKPGKPQQGPYGLPSVQELKEKLQLNPDQVKTLAALYKEYQPKKGGPKEGGMQPGADQGKEFKAKHDELVAKINAFLTEEQKAVFKKLLESLRKGMKKKEGGPK